MTRRGLNLTELLGVLVIVGILAALVMPRIAGRIDSGESAACKAHQGEIELQTQLWRRAIGSYPSSDLSNIGANINYFPQGLPTCPVDGTAYTIDTTTGLVVGHNH